ncbi:hypothetical protein THRCLA_04075 [Thraustotheca clavata]|uniref:Uncharacterized protein n=1 Tax=Thraustotheca clavata TaxID=74557 RepID=A0A1W0A005_9STRA|nr:hypothetical protein THRCLA_04075 [Thraustotheca clavata]
MCMALATLLQSLQRKEHIDGMNKVHLKCIAFGHDLKSVIDNSTAMGGKSLLRPSGQFAFTNISLYSVYLQSTSLIASPKNNINAVKHSFLGPFGSVDMIFVEVTKHFLQFIQKFRREEPILYLNIHHLSIFVLFLQRGQEIIFSLSLDRYLCPVTKVISIQTARVSFGFDAHCESGPRANLSYINNALFATIFANLNKSVKVDDVCSTILQLDNVQNLNIEWMLFGRVSFRSPIKYTPYEWTIGNREVVSFQACGLIPNANSICIIAQRGVQHVTYVMTALASITFVYILPGHGFVEGLNMFELSHVGGIVWAGRPLILFRSLTTLCILSSATFDLKATNGINYFTKVFAQWYRTCLAANEVTWLAGIVTDILIVYTTERTLKYATANSILVWVLSACIALLMPVVPEFTINPQCQIDILDYQVVCNWGNIDIGSLPRLLLLCVIVILCNGTYFISTRLLCKQTSHAASSSLLLSGGTRFLVEQ